MQKNALRCMIGLLSVTLIFISNQRAAADVKLPHVIASNMVFQSDMPMQVWGWADPNEDVSVKFAANEAKTKADAQGKWAVKLPAMKAGGPYEMTVAGKNTITLINILVGEVWLCSGQSNMALHLKDTAGAEAEIASANHPQIRFFSVPWTLSPTPTENVPGCWVECAPANVPVISGTAYYFGKELNKELKVPVGLIIASYGATRVEAWTPLADILSSPAFKGAAKEVKDAEAVYQKALKTYAAAVESWLPQARRAVDSNSFIPMPPMQPVHPMTLVVNPLKPTANYNGMIHSLTRLAIRGAIWYQGESNLCDHNDTYIYTDKMKVLINSWRRIWGQGDFPFYYVQLAPFSYFMRDNRNPEFLPALWQAQTEIMNAVPNTGMAVTNDIGDFNDIHPKNKRDVGKRLALWAFAKTYGLKDIVYSGPIFKSMSVEGSKIRVNFEYAGSGLVSRDGKALNWFEIAGEDKKFVTAEAKIDGDSVVVWNDSIAKPAAVRFAWFETAKPNLMNKEGLPASAFTTEKD